jgi:hypothetical protein
MIFRGGENSTGELGNFHPALTVGRNCQIRTADSSKTDRKTTLITVRQ